MKRETWPLTFHSSFVICLLSEHILTVQQDFTDVELAFDEPVSIALGERGAHTEIYQYHDQRGRLRGNVHLKYLTLNLYDRLLWRADVLRANRR